MNCPCPGVSIKHNITTFPPQPPCSFLTSITNTFRQFRSYPHIKQLNPNSDYSFQRALYISILEFKLWSQLLYPKSPIIGDYMKLLRSLATQIEKAQKDSSVVVTEQQAFEMLLGLEKALREATPRTDIIKAVPMIRDLDYLMVMLVRKAVRFSIGLEASMKVNHSAVDRIEFGVEPARVVAQMFQIVVQLYYKATEFREPELQNGIYFGYCDGNIYSFYTYPTKPLIELQQQRTIRIDTQPNSNPNPSSIAPPTTPKPPLTHSSIFQSRQVINQTCSLCNRLVAESESLNWNYKRYCNSCIFNPQVELNMIPQEQIRKFVQEQKMANTISIVCPVCEQVVVLKNYNPASKTPLYKCGRCAATVCIKHNLDAQICFEVCKKCRVETYSDELLQLKICLKCKQKYCMNCKDGKCNCRCRRCYQPIDDTHKCPFDKQCHECLNVYKNMLECSCGEKLCRSCALPRLETTADGKLVYRCSKR